MEKPQKAVKRGPRRDAQRRSPSQPQTGVNAPRGPRWRRRRRGCPPVRGFRVVKLPGDRPTHQQPPIVHCGGSTGTVPPTGPTATARTPASERLSSRRALRALHVRAPHAERPDLRPPPRREVPPPNGSCAPAGSSASRGG